MFINRFFFGSHFIFVLLGRAPNSMNCLTVKILIMNTLRNKVQLIGNLGNDPEILKLDAGRMRAKFALATNNTYRNAKGEKVKDTQWHTIIAWGKQAEILEQYATKGKEIAVEGKLSNRSYETPEGEKRYITEIVCNEILLLGSK